MKCCVVQPGCVSNLNSNSELFSQPLISLSYIILSLSCCNCQTCQGVAKTGADTNKVYGVHISGYARAYWRHRRRCQVKAVGGACTTKEMPRTLCSCQLFCCICGVNRNGLSKSVLCTTLAVTDTKHEKDLKYDRNSQMQGKRLIK